MFPLLPHISTTLSKAYLPQLSLPRITCLTIKKKNYKAYKMHKTQFEEVDETLELGSDMAGMWELSVQEFKTAMIGQRTYMHIYYITQGHRQ